ncbi:MAG: PD-(D/E)XK nuclease family protein [Bacteroidales bacterium]|nr:PD-(D/E)XK nuclease family protein [Bacteroidales bacterium]
MNDEIELFGDSIALVNEIYHLSDISNLIDFDEINKLTVSFMSIYQTEKNKLPYHINILDLLWANENANSRIFAELLKQKNDNKSEILHSFLCYLTTQNADFNQRPVKPQITSEKERIDILVIDKDFAIIIENKIHDAVDQVSQIARYIDKVKKMGFKETQIYFIYLTKYGNKKPENQSWINENGTNYRELFSKRYFQISFRHDILPWLTDYVLPNCKVKDVYLKSTIEQYIDYLEGMFNLRKINHKMNSELQKHIKEALELNSTPEKNHYKLTNKLSQLIKVEEQIKSMLQSTEKECWNSWLRQLKIDFPNLVTVDYVNAIKFPKVGVIIEYNGYKFAILIEKETNIYYGIGRHEASAELNEEVKSFLKPLLEGFKETPWWYGWKYTTFENGYGSLKVLIENVLIKISVHPNQ